MYSSAGRSYRTTTSPIWSCFLFCGAKASSRIELALRILEPGKNWNINETFGFNILQVSIITKKSWQRSKIGRIFFQAHFQDGRHRPYWKMNLWWIGHTIKCNSSFLTILMVANPFPILFMHSEVYLAIYANIDILN